MPALLLAFTVYCLIDVVRSESSDVRGLPKLAWVGLVLLFPLAGGAAWFIAGRPRNTRPPGTERLGAPRPPVVGPDDDPDFLRSIDRPAPVDPPTPLDGDGPGGKGTTGPAGPTGDPGGKGQARGDEGSSRGVADEPGGQDPDRT